MSSQRKTGYLLFLSPLFPDSLKWALKCHKVLLEKNAHVYLCSRSKRSETMKKKS